MDKKSVWIVIHEVKDELRRKRVSVRSVHSCEADAVARISEDCDYHEVALGDKLKYRSYGTFLAVGRDGALTEEYIVEREVK